MFLFVGYDHLRKYGQLYGGWIRCRCCFLHYLQKLFDPLAGIFVLSLVDMNHIAKFIGAQYVDQSVSVPILES